MTITVQLKRNDDTRSLALERTPSYSEILGISKQLFGIKDAEVSLKVKDDTKNDLVQISDAELAAVNDGLLQIIISDLRKSGGLRASAGLRRSQSLPNNCTATPCYSPSASSNSPSSNSPSSSPSNDTLSCTNDPIPPPTIVEPPSPASLVDRFYELVKYLNVPDVLHGLENFGYVTADQSVEIFALLEQLMVLFPDLAKVLKYEDHEKPIHTVRHFGVTCDSCFETDICGTRYKCAICPDFDMCEKCERKGILTHDITHPRIKMLVPSSCTFEHSCKSFNSQGEKHEDSTCPFTDFVPPPVSPSRTYEKRRAQFNALYQRKQLREAMFELEMRRRRQYLKHREEMEQRHRAKLGMVLSKEEKKEGEKEGGEGEKEQNNSGGNKKGILWGYFDNLKKQNKLQNIAPAPLTSSGPVSPTPPSPSAPIPSSALSASTPTSLASSLCSSGPLSTPSSLASSEKSNTTSPTITPASAFATSAPSSIPSFPSAPPSMSSSDSSSITNPRATRSASLSQSTGVCSTSASWTTETDLDEPKAVDPYLAMSRVRKEKIEEIEDEDEDDDEEKEETENKEEAKEKKISATEDYHPRPPLVPTISSRLKVMQQKTLSIPDSPDTSPVLPHLALGTSPTSPAPLVSKLRQGCTVMEAEEEEYEDDEYDDEDEEEESESGSGSDKNDLSSVEADSLHVLNDMGFDEKNGDLLSTIRKKKGDLFSTLRELLN